MKSHIYILFAFLIVTSCEMNYEHNPNESSIVPTSGLLNAAQKGLLDATRSEDFAGGQMLVWMQYWNNNIYTEEGRYLYQEPTNLDAWNDIYSVAQNLISIIELNTDNETKDLSALYGSNESQIAVARVMLVYTYLMAVELWGDVPYYSYGSDNTTFQANQLNDGIFQPAYASQEDIYTDMLSVLEETALVFASTDYVMDGDNIFDGDADQWYLFTNSLRLRIANRVKDALPEASSFIDIAKVNPSLFMSSNADNAGLTYENNAENGAPMYKFFEVENKHYYGVSLSFIELLKGNSYDGTDLDSFTADPRLAAYAEKNTNGDYVGMPMVKDNNTATAFNDESEPSLSITAIADRTLSYLDYAEVCFIMSEINDWDQSWYEEGIRASMQQWGIEESEIENFMLSVAAATEATVMTQKYIALYMQPMEAWSEYRRTGYPNTLILPYTTYLMTWPTKTSEGNDTIVSQEFTFTPIVDITDIPSRNKYPINEMNINKTNLDAASVNMGGDAQDVKLWWME